MSRRPGRTVKLSISIDKEDLALLKKRAKRLSGGNISAAISDAIRISREWEGREALATWLGEGREAGRKPLPSSGLKRWRKGSGCHAPVGM